MVKSCPSRPVYKIRYECQLPEFTRTSLCDHFSKYFVHKIETTRSKFQDKVQNIPLVHRPYIITISMNTSTFPKKIQRSSCRSRPLLKKTYLPKKEPKTYMRVSNFHFQNLRKESSQSDAS